MNLFTRYYSMGEGVEQVFIINNLKNATRDNFDNRMVKYMLEIFQVSLLLVVRQKFVIYIFPKRIIMLVELVKLLLLKHLGSLEYYLMF